MFRLPRKTKKKFKYRHEVRYKSPFLTSCHYNIYHYIWLYKNTLFHDIDDKTCINWKYPRTFTGNLTQLKKEINKLKT